MNLHIAPGVKAKAVSVAIAISHELNNLIGRFKIGLHASESVTRHGKLSVMNTKTIVRNLLLVCLLFGVFPSLLNRTSAPMLRRIRR